MLEDPNHSISAALSGMKALNSINWFPIGITLMLASTGLGLAALFLKEDARKDLLAMMERIFRNQDGSQTDKDKRNKSSMYSDTNNAESYAETLTGITADSMGVAHLYKSLQAASITLKLYVRLLPDTYLSEQEKIALQDFLKLLLRVEQNLSSTHRMISKVKTIVIEGLKRSGKTKLINTIVPKLPSRYRAVVVPKEFEDVEELFAAAPESIAKAFACLRNYIIMNQIYEDYEANPLDDRHYFIDGFYHSTCVSTIMSQADAPDDQTLVSSVAYEWPLDLPIPNMVVYLHVPTEVRLQRFDQEAAVVSDRSKHRSIARDEKSQLAFSMVKGPLTIAIDANAVPAEVCEVTVEALGEYGFIIPKGMSGFSSPSHKRSSVGVYGALSQLP
jgi:thymidylate kinase